MAGDVPLRKPKVGNLAMRRLDEAGLDMINTQPVSETDLGFAITGRLRRAAVRA